MCTHFKTVKYTFIWQTVSSSSLKVNYLAIFFVYSFCVSLLFIYYKKHIKLQWIVNKITKIPATGNSTLILLL